MLVSQLIYTGCPGYGVWSKSEDITTQEAKEIEELLTYTSNVDHAPWNLTAEHWKLFPRHYAYFELSSGRMCAAQITYVGVKYSENDNRIGNFLIHAFVFDKPADFNMYTVIDPTLYRYGLEKSEWMNPAPASLPKKEVLFSKEPYFPALKNFIAKNRADAELFLASMLRVAENGYLSFMTEQAEYPFTETFENGGSNSDVMHFNKQEDLKACYAMATLLPKQIKDKLTFCTDFKDSVTSPFAANVKMRNFMNNAAAFGESWYNPDEEIKFDLTTHKPSKEVAVSRYVTEILQDYLNNPEAAMQKIKSIEEILSAVGDLDRALAVYHVIHCDFDWFSDREAYFAARQSLPATVSMDKETLAARMYDTIVVKKRWGYGEWVLPQLNFIYQNTTDNGLKRKIVIEYVANYAALGVKEMGALQAVVADFFGKAPCSKTAIVSCLLNDENARLKDGSDYWMAIVLEAMIDAYGRNASPEKSKETIMYLLKKAAMKGRSKDLKYQFDCLNRIPQADREIWIKELWAQYVASSAFTFGIAFDILLASKDAEWQAEQIIDMIKRQGKSASFTEIYMAQKQANPERFAVIEKALDRLDPTAFRAFIELKEIADFRSAATHTKGELFGFMTRYCGRYELARTIYLEKMTEILKNTGKDIFNTCWEFFERIEKMPTDPFVKNQLSLIAKRINAMPLNMLYAECPEPVFFEKLKELNDRLLSDNVDYIKKLRSLAFLYLINEKMGSKELYDAIKTNTLYAKLEQRDYEQVIGCAGDLLKLYYTKRKKTDLADEDLVRAIILPLLVQSYSYKYNLADAFKLIKDKDERFVILRGFMMFDFHYAEKEAAFSDLFNEIMKESEGKEYKYLAKELRTTETKDKEKVEKYLKKYEPQRTSFLDWLFSRKK